METHQHEAVEKKLSGRYNCAQAIVCSYPELTGLDSEQSRAVAAAFAAGMGNMQGTCGALVGAGIVLGLHYHHMPQALAAMRQVITRFEQRNGATQCHQLKGIATGKVLRECHLCVADAAQLLEEALQKQEQ